MFSRTYFYFCPLPSKNKYTSCDGLMITIASIVGMSSDCHRWRCVAYSLHFCLQHVCVYCHYCNLLLLLPNWHFFQFLWLEQDQAWSKYKLKYKPSFRNRKYHGEFCAQCTGFPVYQTSFRQMQPPLKNVMLISIMICILWKSTCCAVAWKIIPMLCVLLLPYWPHVNVKV